MNKIQFISIEQMYLHFYLSYLLESFINMIIYLPIYEWYIWGSC